MEILGAIVPFFTAGFFAAVCSRMTGVNMSMCLLMIFLYMGAKPGELIVAMLLFNGFTYFTIYSQAHTMAMKNFVIFPGVKFLIPFVITLALAVLSPFLGIVFFIIVFLLEIFAKIYLAMNKKARPTIPQLVKMGVIASVCAVAGTALVQYIPEAYYYIVAGVVLLGYVVFMWLAGGNRRQWESKWDGILYGSAFLTGLTGIDPTDWLTAMRRTTQSALSRCYPIVINSAMIVALVVAYGLYHYFSLGALFATIGASLGIRVFGLPVYSERGKFSYITLGILFVAVLVFMITQPQPTGMAMLPITDGESGFFDL